MSRKDLELSEIRGSEDIVGRPGSVLFSSRGVAGASGGRAGIVPVRSWRCDVRLEEDVANAAKIKSERRSYGRDGVDARRYGGDTAAFEAFADDATISTLGLRDGATLSVRYAGDAARDLKLHAGAGLKARQMRSLRAGTEAGDAAVDGSRGRAGRTREDAGREKTADARGR